MLLHAHTRSLTMSSVKIFSSALKAAVSKINSIVSDMDEKVDTFADQVLDIFVDYEENLFKNDEDKADIKQKIVGLFEMFQPEKRAPSVSGYNVFCKEQREAVKAKNPDLSASAILAALGAEWKALDKDEKEEWNAKAKLAKPMTTEEKSAKRSASRKPAGAKAGAEKKEKVKCQYDGCDRCPKEPKEHDDGKIYCAKHLDKVILTEKKSPKSTPKKSPKTEEKSEKKSVSKKTEKVEKSELSAKEKLEKKLEEANKKLAEKTSAVSAPKPITVSPKTSAKPAPVKKTTFDFTSEPKPISENLEFWAVKRVNLNKNTDGKKWRYNAATGLCFEDNDDFALAATWVNGAVAWLDEIPEEVKEWARNSGCEVPADEDDDIELDGQFSDNE